MFRIAQKLFDKEFHKVERRYNYEEQSTQNTGTTEKKQIFQW
jgi:hypothetical protein